MSETNSGADSAASTSHQTPITYTAAPVQLTGAALQKQIEADARKVAASNHNGPLTKIR